MKNKLEKLSGILGLSLSLARANFKLRNEGSYLGIFWYLLNPLALFLIILFIKGAAFSTVPIKFYPLYLFLGIIMYNFFSKILTSAITIIEKNGGLIKSIKINYEPFVISEVLEATFSHVFEIFLLIILMISSGVPLWGIIYYFIIFIIFCLFILGVALIFSIVGAYIKDFSNIWVIATQLLFFITPIFYLLKGDTWLYKINLLNPLYYFLSIARDVTIYGKMPELYIIAGTFFFSITFFMVGIIIFNKFKSKLAELI